MRFLRLLRAILFDCVQLWLVYAATSLGSVGAARVLLFVGVLCAIGGFVVCTSYELKAATLYANRRTQYDQRANIYTPTRLILSRITDGLSVAMLVYAGFWWTAICYTLMALSLEVMVLDLREFQEKLAVEEAKANER